MVYMSTRTQIYLTDDQRARLSDRARRDGIPVSQLIRQAVDKLMEDEDDLDATFGILPTLGSGIPSRSEWVRDG